MHKLKIALIAFAVILTSCHFGNAVLIDKCSVDSIEFQKVELNEIFENPAAFDGKYVEVKGIYYFGFEESSLVERRGESADCIYVSIGQNRQLSEKMEDMKYVSRIRIRGRIDIEEKGHLNSCKLGITDICYFEVIN